MTGGWNPINKNLWSVSFVLLAGGLAFLLIAALYFFIDVKGYWWGSPLREAGMNSITLYVGHQVKDSMTLVVAGDGSVEG